jgi:hypothetical protein
VTNDGRKHHVDSCFNIWHYTRDIEAQHKMLMKLGTKQAEDNKRTIRHSSETKFKESIRTKEEEKEQ